MTTSRRRQQRYDHRLRDLVHNTGDVTIATDRGVPRGSWLAPKRTESCDNRRRDPLTLDPASRGFDVDVGSAPDIIALIAGCGGITLR